MEVESRRGMSMPDEARILALAEETLNSGFTAEEVCAQDPELLEAVRERLNWYRGVGEMVEQLFPSTPAAERKIVYPALEKRLPAIPGYEVLGVLGRGGVGIVYRVRHLKLSRVAALKMLL